MVKAGNCFVCLVERAWEMNPFTYDANMVL
jgi:hypothetical protein